MVSSFRILSLAAVTLAIGVVLSGPLGLCPARNSRKIPSEESAAECSRETSNSPDTAPGNDEERGVLRIGTTVESQFGVEHAEFARNATSNQERANAVATALRKAKLSDFEIEISARGDVVILDGHVASQEQRIAAGQAAASVKDVARVENHLKIVDPANAHVPAAHRDEAGDIGQALPSAYYLKDDLQYFPPGPEFKLSRQVQALEEYKLRQQHGRGVPEKP